MLSLTLRLKRTLENQDITGAATDLQRLVEISDRHPLLLKLAASWLYDPHRETPDAQYLLSQNDLNLFKHVIYSS